MTANKPTQIILKELDSTFLELDQLRHDENHSFIIGQKESYTLYRERIIDRLIHVNTLAELHQVAKALESLDIPCSYSNNQIHLTTENNNAPFPDNWLLRRINSIRKQYKNIRQAIIAKFQKQKA